MPDKRLGKLKAVRGRPREVTREHDRGWHVAAAGRNENAKRNSRAVRAADVVPRALCSSIVRRCRAASFHPPGAVHTSARVRRHCANRSRRCDRTAGRVHRGAYCAVLGVPGNNHRHDWPRIGDRDPCPHEAANAQNSPEYRRPDQHGVLVYATKATFQTCSVPLFMVTTTWLRATPTVIGLNPDLVVRPVCRVLAVVDNRSRAVGREPDGHRVRKIRAIEHLTLSIDPLHAS